MSYWSFVEHFLIVLFEVENGAYVNGSALQFYLKGQEINANTSLFLKVFLPHLNASKNQNVVDRIHQKLSNLQSVHEFHTHTIYAPNVDQPNSWKTDLYVSEHEKVDVYFVPFCTKNFLFDVDAVMLGRQGICIPYFVLEKEILPCPTFLSVIRALRNLNTGITSLMIGQKKQRINKQFFAELAIEQRKKIEQKNTVVDAMTVSKNNDDMCAVCLKTSHECIMFVLECNHAFCMNCLDQHRCNDQLAQCNNCPLCRQPIFPL